MTTSLLKASPAGVLAGSSSLAWAHSGNHADIAMLHFHGDTGALAFLAVLVVSSLAIWLSRAPRWLRAEHDRKD